MQKDCDVEVSLGYTVRIRTCSFQTKKAKIKRAIEKTVQQGAQDAEAKHRDLFRSLHWTLEAPLGKLMAARDWFA